MSEQQKPSLFQQHSATIKGALVAFLAIILLIPTQMIQSLIREREGRADESKREIFSKWANSQTITGPILSLPYKIALSSIGTNAQGQNSTTLTYETRYIHILPESLNVDAKLNPELRYRGIYEVAVYTGEIGVKGTFKLSEEQFLNIDPGTILWEQALITIGLNDLRGLKDQVALTWDEHKLLFEPGIPIGGLQQSGIHTQPDLTSADFIAGKEIAFSFDLDLKGSESLYITPVGKLSQATLYADWKNPSFVGAFLPADRDINEKGFKASWKVLHLNRNYPQVWTYPQSPNFSESDFGVNLLLPVDNYQKSERSTKYAILFIGLTFLLFFFIELRQGERIHPFQYTLVGLALVIFYTLLVSLSEHISFNRAYGVATVMTIALIVLYSRSLVRGKRLPIVIGASLGLLYGFLFTIIQLQDYALLVGSLGLFLILAVVMYYSRSIGWYKSSDSTDKTAKE